jgi:hypothetical protein
MDLKINFMKKNIKISEKRRILLKGIAALPLLGGAAAFNIGIKSTDKFISKENQAALKNINGVLPKGKLGKYEISRLIVGCNPMGGWSHSRDLRYVGALSKNYHTPAKMKEIWALAEQAGINFANLELFQYKIFNEYKKETGSKMLNVRQCSIGQPNDRLATVKEAVDLGADFIYIQGANAENLYKSGALDVLGQALEYVHSQKMLFGIGAHSIMTVIESRKLGIKPDFYYKTIHHDNYWSATPRGSRVEFKPYKAGVAEERRQYQRSTVLAGSPNAPRVDRNSSLDNMWDQFPEQTIETFKSIDVPWFGFKVMAAGALTPQDGIRYAFENGADFVCAGMYDWQIIEDVNTTIEILGSLGKRERPWYS